MQETTFRTNPPSLLHSALCSQLCLKRGLGGGTAVALLTLGTHFYQVCSLLGMPSAGEVKWGQRQKGEQTLPTSVWSSDTEFDAAAVG